MEEQTGSFIDYLSIKIIMIICANIHIFSLGAILMITSLIKDLIKRKIDLVVI